MYLESGKKKHCKCLGHVTRKKDSENLTLTRHNEVKRENVSNLGNGFIYGIIFIYKSEESGEEYNRRQLQFIAKR